MTRRYQWQDDGNELSDAKWDTVDALVAKAWNEIETEASSGVASLTIKKGVFTVEHVAGEDGGAIDHRAWVVCEPISAIFNNVATGLDGSGGIALPAGSYHVHALQKSYEVNGGRLGWFQKNGDNLIILGDSNYFSSGHESSGTFHLAGIFSSSEEYFDLRMWIDAGAFSEQSGRAADTGGFVERYALIEITKLDYDLSG